MIGMRWAHLISKIAFEQVHHFSGAAMRIVLIRVQVQQLPVVGSCPVAVVENCHSYSPMNVVQIYLTVRVLSETATAHDESRSLTGMITSPLLNRSTRRVHVRTYS